jgi:hypothetical protein
MAIGGGSVSEIVIKITTPLGSLAFDEMCGSQNKLQVVVEERA